MDQAFGPKVETEIFGSAESLRNALAKFMSKLCGWMCAVKYSTRKRKLGKKLYELCAFYEWAQENGIAYGIWQRLTRPKLSTA
jgi:hypothetical protein